MNENGKTSIMFVCLGNICRSPMAQAVFEHVVKQRHLEEHFDRIESAGTGGYHVGDEPDDRTVAKCRQKAWLVPVRHDLPQVIERRHFDEFDYILGMDDNNVRNLKSMQPKNSKAKVQLFGEFGDGRIIDDPYYGGKSGFEKTYQQVAAYTDGLLDHLGFAEDAKV
ncbi:Low molecular weight phosphotyrosine protein phosphatase [Cystobasidiomycetes sp. EMM_F5]